MAAADKVTCFSNTDTTLDLLAPGAVITSDGLGSGLSSFIGTSQASPHCAGAAALLLQINATLTPAQIESTLKSTGKPITDSRTGMITPRIDLLAAVQATPRAVHTHRGDARRNIEAPPFLSTFEAGLNGGRLEPCERAG